jgi:hypothetical protein
MEYSILQLLSQHLLMTTHLLSFNTYSCDISDKSDEST